MDLRRLAAFSGAHFNALKSPHIQGMTADREPSPGGAGPSSAEASDSWEAAYLRFETPEQEVRKFVARLRRLGCDDWPRGAAIVELFCGRGNGLRALHQLGFTRVLGLDRSAALLGHAKGEGELVLGDCRNLPFADGSCDVAIVQGGLHHLPANAETFQSTIHEVRRVLSIGGRLLAIEPWRTPFLEMVHRVARNSLARRLSPRIEALGPMIELEGETYRQWLAAPARIRKVLTTAFFPEICRERLGKLLFVGQKR